MSANSNNSFEALLDERDIARLTKRSLASVRRDRLLRKGVPCIHIGSSVRYTPEALRTFLKACEYAAAS
jgi:hypothetical protein